MLASTMLRALLVCVACAVIQSLASAQNLEKTPHQDQKVAAPPQAPRREEQQQPPPQPQQIQPFVPLQTAIIEGEQWRQLHARVFASHQTSTSQRDRLSPEQTREILRQLQEIYYGKYWKHLHGANLQTSEIWWTQLSKIAALLRVSHVSSERCYAQNFAEFNRLVAMSQQNTLNLLPYLYHYRGLQLEHCKRYANEHLHSTIVASLGSEEVVKMDHLAELVKQNLDQQPMIHQSASQSQTGQVLARAVADLLGRQALGMVSSPVEFEELFRREILDFCYRVARTVDPVEYIAELEGSYPPLNQAGYEWVKYADICRDILRRSQDISGYLFELMGPRSNSMNQFPQPVHHNGPNPNVFEHEILPEPILGPNPAYNQAYNNYFPNPMPNPVPNPVPNQFSVPSPNHQYPNSNQFLNSNQYPNQYQYPNTQHSNGPYLDPYMANPPHQPVQHNGYDPLRNSY